MDIPKGYEDYKKDKLENTHTFSTSLKVCELLYNSCATNKEIERVWAMAHNILDIPKSFNP